MNEELKEDVAAVKTKRNWAKRHMKLIIVCSVVLALITPLIVYICYINAWNAGMGLPEGYGNGGYPITFGKYSGKPLAYQFEEDNSPINNITDKIYFYHNEEKYYLQIDKKNLIDNEYNYIVYKEADEVKIGEFVANEDENIDSCFSRSFFYDDHYIYYIFLQSIKRYYYEFSLQGSVNERSYFKYTFYRLDLDTGENEDISINLFVEKINKYDDTIKINN